MVSFTKGLYNFLSGRSATNFSTYERPLATTPPSMGFCAPQPITVSVPTPNVSPKSNMGRRGTRGSKDAPAKAPEPVTFSWENTDNDIPSWDTAAQTDNANADATPSWDTPIADTAAGGNDWGASDPAPATKEDEKKSNTPKNSPKKDGKKHSPNNNQNKNKGKGKEKVEPKKEEPKKEEPKKDEPEDDGPAFPWEVAEEPWSAKVTETHDANSQKSRSTPYALVSDSVKAASVKAPSVKAPSVKDSSVKDLKETEEERRRRKEREREHEREYERRRDRERERERDRERERRHRYGRDYHSHRRPSPVRSSVSHHSRSGSIISSFTRLSLDTARSTYTRDHNPHTHRIISRNEESIDPSTLRIYEAHSFDCPCAVSGVRYCWHHLTPQADITHISIGPTAVMPVNSKDVHKFGNSSTDVTTNLNSIGPAFRLALERYMDSLNRKTARDTYPGDYEVRRDEFVVGGYRLPDAMYRWSISAISSTKVKGGRCPGSTITVLFARVLRAYSREGGRRSSDARSDGRVHGTASGSAVGWH